MSRIIDQERRRDDVLAYYAAQEPLVHMSNRPWSSYSESDYTLEQWHQACLIHQHDGSPISKSQCKLPIRTPSGVVNLNGMFAAAAALAGARTPMNASSEEKTKAARALLKLYSEAGKTPPDSLKQLGS